MIMIMRVVIVLALLVLIPSPVRAEPRFALLIGNRAYDAKVGPLKNPHRDLDLVGAALAKLDFKVTALKDATYKDMDIALKRHVRVVNGAGAGAVSFFYYSGHGVANPETQINYLIPVDVTTTDDERIWDEALQQNVIIDLLSKQAAKATHFVVFDACRNELKLAAAGTKAVGAEKGFAPLLHTAGLLIAYATAPKLTASDVGEDGGPYAKALSEEIVKPGIEAVTMFRNVQLKVKQTIGQDPWLSFPSLPAVYFAGAKPPEQVEMMFWVSVKDTTEPAVLATYLERYPNGEFASIARALIEHYERQIKAERAAREEEAKRAEEERRNAEVRRLEDERRAREEARAQERRGSVDAHNDAEVKRLEEQQRSELVARTEALRRALEEARLARDAARAAEEQRLAALKAAEDATKQAEHAIATKRDATNASDRQKIAALPKLEKPNVAPAFDGKWNIVRSGQNCDNPHYTFSVSITGSAISGYAGNGPLRGSVSSSGAMRFTHPSYPRGGPKYYSGTLGGGRGRGTFTTSGGNCSGSFTAARN